jgi:repressor LexA
MPILAAETLEGDLNIDRLFGEPANLFVLRVMGDSMVDRRIYEGDYVSVRAQPWVEHGDVGVVVIDEEVTVKTILRRRTGLWLKPENQQQGYPSIRLRPQQRVRIVGNVLAVGRLPSTKAISGQRAALSKPRKAARDHRIEESGGGIREPSLLRRSYSSLT